MAVYVANANAHVSTLVSTDKIVTLLEEYITEEHRSVVRFLWAKGVNAKEIYLRYVTCLRREVFVT
jgi:hypothetical protein